MKKLFLILLLCSTALSVSAQSKANKNDMTKYRRSSLYSVLISHPNAEYSREIQTAFLNVPIPDKFNDHNLDARVITSSAAKMKQAGKSKEQSNEHDIQEFIASTQPAKGMVSKWFMRDAMGTFDISLVQERGFYDASQAAISSAENTERHLAMLGDAGEDLIGKTFMLVNDITFIDKGKGSAIAAGAIRGLGLIAGSILGSGVSDMADLAAKATNEIDGFTINVSTYLYQLDWNDEIGGTFYKMYWHDKENYDSAKRRAYEADRNLFKLKYIGKTSASADNLASKSFSKKTKEEQMLKVCARAVDKAIVELQRSYEEFRVNTPIQAVGKNTVDVQIGLKEGVNEKSVYEVLLPVEDENGKLTYRRVAQIKPIKGQIWDNRFGALDEAQELIAAGKKNKIEGNAFTDHTTFKILNGANQIIPGCVVREQTIKATKK